MKKIINVIGNNLVNQSENSIRVILRFSDRCNYNCDYCYHRDNTDDFMNLDYYLDYVDRLFNELSSKDKVHVYVHGGEPTIIPNFKTIIKKILTYENVGEIMIQSNMSQPIEYFSDFVGFNGKVKFGCSYQHHMNRKKDFSVFVDKVKFLFDNDLFTNINCSLENMNIPEVVEKIKQFDDMEWIKGRIIFCYIQCSDDDIKSYSEVHEIIDNSYFDEKDGWAVKVTFKDGSIETFMNYTTLIESGYNKYKKFTCTAGNKNLVVQPNGDLYYCLSHESTGKPIGNVFINGDVKRITEKKIMICTFPICSCELWLEKKRIGNY